MKKSFLKIFLTSLVSLGMLGFSSCSFLLGALFSSGEPEYATFDPDNPKVGQTKFIYIDTNPQQTNFAMAKTKLRGIGEKCNVWVVDGYHTDDSTDTRRYFTYRDGMYVPGGFFQTYTPSSSTKISDVFVREVTEKFDSIYPIVTYIYGTESSKIYDFNTKKYVPMSRYDETNEKINIVIYDIGYDSTNGGVLGYFWSKDYFTNSISSTLPSDYANSVVQVSNQGKYFYIDSYWSKSTPGEVYSTLGHEFQHMIDYGVKVIDHKLNATGSAHNEMMSMICEDLLLDYLGLSNAEGPYLRLPQFNGSYLFNGPEDYIEEYVHLSYASAYAFGAWLTRNLGGVELVREMAQNYSSDMECVVNAVNTVNGTNYTVEDIIRMYSFACINKSDVIQLPSFNNAITKSASQTGLDTDLKLAPIDLWKLDYLLYNRHEENTTSNVYESIQPMYYFAYDGPRLYTTDSYSNIRPFGMMLCSAGKINSTTATLTFNTSSTGTQTWTYNAETPWVEVKSNTKTLTITGLPKGKNLYISKTNPTSKILYYESDRYLSNATGVSEPPSNSIKPLSNTSEQESPVIDRAAVDSALGKHAGHCYQPPVILPPDMELDRAAAASTIIPNVAKEHVYVVIN